MKQEGKIHSIETCGTVDGPGLRTVIFLQGCPLRCIYCHNPDTWLLKDGKTESSDNIIKEVTKYRSYIKFSGGGITLSGGEPLMQPDFATDIILKCKKENIHTAIDTSGCIYNDKTKKLLKETDLILLDIKAADEETYKQITSHEIDSLKQTIAYINDINKPLWVRHVVVPGITDSDKHLNNMLKLLKSLSSLEKLELLPFHKMGEYKWENSHIKYTLDTVLPPEKTKMDKISAFFAKNGINMQ